MAWFKQAGVWLVALFLMVLGAQLWVVWLYGSPLPIWDQWYQAKEIFKPWLEGNLQWHDLFAPDSDHRIVVTHLFDIALIRLNGQWDPLLQMTVNAVIHAAFACGLAYTLWRFFDRQNAAWICFLLLPFFTLPYAGENAIWGINSLWYFVNILALITVVGLGFTRPASRWWWAGLVSATVGLFVMATGLLAPAAVAGLIILRTLKSRRWEPKNGITFGVSLVLTAVGAALSVTAERNHELQAHTLGQFLSALLRNLMWPFIQLPGMAIVLLLPLGILLFLYFRANFSACRRAELLLTLALWSLSQSGVIAFGRANYGDVVPASRYMDVFNICVIASLFAVVLLGALWEQHRHPAWLGKLMPLAFAAIVFVGLCRISGIVVDDLLQPTRLMNLIGEERVQTFLRTGDDQDLLQPPTVRPDPRLTLEILRDPKLQTILPPICHAPRSPVVTGRFTNVVQSLLKHSVAILAAGLVLFAVLCGCGMKRGAFGMTGKNPLELVAFAGVLAALVFVWSERAATRVSVERNLQQQLSANFQSVNNPARAEVHRHLADAVNAANQFAN
ncbi:MAG TPA: hypothetical protein VFV81_03965 [Verrucomicrobiae bacterium]|nr:hypothetical protein [Verrucomicrobiae bacterium]